MILEAKNVLYSYKTKRDKIILKNVSATLRKLRSMRLSVPVVQEKPHSFPFWRAWITRYQEPFFIMERIFVKRG